jgi:hypothetical protein
MKNVDVVAKIYPEVPMEHYILVSCGFCNCLQQHHKLKILKVMACQERTFPNVSTIPQILVSVWLMHVKCIHDFCTLPLDISSYLHYILVIFMFFDDY